jgi:antitoxin (DNA-binding transcriptional repressor) of toxin-antitoxin stability system
MVKMIQQFTPTQAKKRLNDLIDAALLGETIRIIKGDEAGVELVPFASRKGGRKFGSAKGQIWMSDDFNSPIDDYEPTYK